MVLQTSHPIDTLIENHLVSVQLIQEDNMTSKLLLHILKLIRLQMLNSNLPTHTSANFKYAT